MKDCSFPERMDKEDEATADQIQVKMMKNMMTLFRRFFLLKFVFYPVSAVHQIEDSRCDPVLEN